jgi:hypothetical protein
LLVLTLGTTLPVPAFTQDTVSRSNETVAELQKLNAVFTFLRKRNTADYAVTAPNGIDESKYVMIGGIEQWISIRGDDRANPALFISPYNSGRGLVRHRAPPVDRRRSAER